MNPPSQLVFWRGFLVILVGLVMSAPVATALAEDLCRRSSLADEAYRVELELYEQCGSAPECLDRRASSIEGFLATAPDDVDLHRIAQFVEKSRGAQAESAMVERYRERAESSGSAVDLYLFARLLGPGDHRESLLSRASMLDPGLPWPHELLARQSLGDGDGERLRHHLDRFLELCPTRFRTYRDYAKVVEDPAFWVPHLTTARRQLEAASPGEAFSRLAELWSLELELFPAGEHLALRRRIAKDLEAVAALDRPHDATWWATLQEGYSLTGDEEAEVRAIRGRAALEPCHGDVVWGVIESWRQANPEPLPVASKAVRDAWLRSKDEVTRGWVESCPSSWLYWSTRLAVAEGWEALSERQVREIVDRLWLEAEIPPHERVNVVSIVARTLMARGIDLDRAARWLEDELAARRQASGAAPADARERSIQEDLLLLLAEIELDRGRLAACRARLEDVVALTGEAALSPEDRGVLEGMDSWSTTELWRLRAELAMAEDRPLDALVFFRQTRWLAPGSLETAERLWRETGGSEQAWQLFLEADASASSDAASGRGLVTSIRRPMPPFELTDLEGNSWNLDRLRGKIVFLDVWFAGCLPCRKAMPWIEKLHQRTSEREALQVLTMTTDATLAPVTALLDEHGYTFPVLRAARYGPEELGVQSYPTQLLIDGEGQIVERIEGSPALEGERWLESMIERMETLARGSQTLDQGR